MADKKEIFSTEIELRSYGLCSHCKGGEDEVGCAVIKLRDKTEGEIHLCRECMGYYHIHVNAEPHIKEVKDKNVDKVREERRIRARTRQPQIPLLPPHMETLLPPQPPPWPQATEKDKADEEKNAEAVLAKCPPASLLAVAVGLLMLDKTRELSFERTVTHGDMSVTERFEIRDDNEV